jgi:putative oxidoreductase
MGKAEKKTPFMADLGLLTLRVTAGGLLAGHGAQKLFGSFGGHGLQGTAAWLESLGFKPGRQWAMAAGASELGGGALMGLGLLHPLGPIALQGAMITATRRAHWNKPIWASQGGAELPVMFMSTGLALIFTGPGRFSLDRMLGISVPKRLSLLAIGAVAAGIAAAERQQAEQGATGSEDVAPEEAVMESPQGGEDTLVDNRPADSLASAASVETAAPGADASDATTDGI